MTYGLISFTKELGPYSCGYERLLIGRRVAFIRWLRNLLCLEWIGREQELEAGRPLGYKIMVAYIGIRRGWM